ncbi:MAG TPA: methyltransferase domain-containing protein [Burkholderiales bacterium]|jgi:SAM-dependent methyltransferase|nr:methyltransferase domain-containing protein [Burkholderiales bacterium]
MNASGRALLGAVLLGMAGQAATQDTGTVHPAPFIPSPPSTVDEMLRLAAVGPGDIVYDLGAGDGRVVIAAAKKFGARGVGVEIDERLIAQARRNAEQAGVADRVRFLEQDLFKTDLREATVVALYLSPNLNEKLRPALLTLAPGTRVVSHASGMGGWRPDRKTSIRKDVLLWIVPARVAGRWRSLPGPGEPARALEFEIKQRFQEVSVDARLDGAPAQVWEARVEGDRLSFVIVERTGTDDEAALYYQGRVAGSHIEGYVARGVGAAREQRLWRAARAVQ